jgi:serine/threonine protein kinase/cytochrome c-type biogenesis protein CcmH/NrfG
MIITAGCTLEHYRFIEKIGEGGMGVVWKARDLKLDRDVAVKFLPDRISHDPMRQSLFEREAKAVAALHHPHIITIFSVENVEGTVFFTMELVEGKPLSDYIVPGGVSGEFFFRIALQLVEAVAAAHERGIIHRDLKPQNIMVDQSENIRILDFGLAQFLEPGSTVIPAEDLETVTMEPAFYGTVCYASPEQLRNEVLDHRADLFSLGIIFFELATGKHPFEGISTADVMASIIKEAPLSAVDINPGLSDRLDAILRHCLEKDRRHRIMSALNLKEELQLIQQEEPVMAVSGVPSVAVLPFVDLSREKDQDYFCEGIAEEIINALAKIQGLRVSSRTSSFLFKGQPVEPKDIGRRLRVENLLEGSVRKAGNRLRITAQLIDALKGFHLWSESYDRELMDIFEIQEEIAESIAAALKITLSPQEKGALQQIPTQFVQAYDYYLRGRSFYYRYGKKDIEFALQLFARATEIDPGYALAYAGLADCWSYIYLYAERKDSICGQAERASRRAIELAPESAQAQASHALAMSISGRTKEAEQGFEEAIRLDPGLFEAWYFYARHAFVSGQLEKAAGYYGEAMQVRPEDFQSPLLVAQIYEDLERLEEAAASRRRGVALVADRRELHPDDARALYMGANGLVALGDVDKGLEWAAQAREIEPDEPMLLYNLGCIYSLAGEPEEALDCLERAVELGLTQKGWYENDSNLDPLRDLPRFKALMRKLG